MDFGYEIIELRNRYLNVLIDDGMSPFEAQMQVVSDLGSMINQQVGLLRKFDEAKQVGQSRTVTSDKLIKLIADHLNEQEIKGGFKSGVLVAALRRGRIRMGTTKAKNIMEEKLPVGGAVETEHGTLTHEEQRYGYRNSKVGSVIELTPYE